MNRILKGVLLGCTVYAIVAIALMTVLLDLSGVWALFVMFWAVMALFVVAGVSTE